MDVWIGVRCCGNVEPWLHPADLQDGALLRPIKRCCHCVSSGTRCSGTEGLKLYEAFSGAKGVCDHSLRAFSYSNGDVTVFNNTGVFNILVLNPANNPPREGGTLGLMVLQL